MNRYQIYLNPTTVDTLNRVAKTIKISRSQIIREVADRAAREYEKIIKASEFAQKRNNPLLGMAGAARSLNKNVSRNINKIYSVD